MAVWRADPKRRGQFVAGHARLQRWIFRLEIGRHQDEGVMVPVGVWRCARPPIGVLFHRALAADKFLRLLAEFALGKSLHVAGNAVNHHVDDTGRRPAFGSSMTIVKLFVPSGAPDQASGGEVFSPTQFGLRCLSAQAFLTASWSLSFKAEEVSTSTSARAAPNDRAKAPANNKLPRAYFMMSSLSVRFHACPSPQDRAKAPFS